MIFPNPLGTEIQHVFQNLRPQSADELAILADGTPEEAAHAFSVTAGLKWVSYFEDTPAAVFGAYPLHRGVWNLFGFGTRHYAQVLREVTKCFRREVFDAVKEAGAHRAQALSPASHHETHKWLEMLGGYEEAMLFGYGRGGEDVKVFAWYEESASVRW